MTFNVNIFIPPTLFFKTAIKKVLKEQTDLMSLGCLSVIDENTFQPKLGVVVLFRHSRCGDAQYKRKECPLLLFILLLTSHIRERRWNVTGWPPFRASVHQSDAKLI